MTALAGALVAHFLMGYSLQGRPVSCTSQKAPGSNKPSGYFLLAADCAFVCILHAIYYILAKSVCTSSIVCPKTWSILEEKQEIMFKLGEKIKGKDLLLPL